MPVKAVMRVLKVVEHQNLDAKQQLVSLVRVEPEQSFVNPSNPHNGECSSVPVGQQSPSNVGF
jgi:hypothetical protein